MKHSIKKLVSLILILAISLAVSVPAFAAEQEKENATTASVYSNGQDAIRANDLLDELNSIDFGKKIHFSLLPQSNGTTRSVNNEMLQFDSVEDFEHFLRNFMKSTEGEGTQVITPMKPSDKQFDSHNAYALRSVSTIENTVSWWGGGNTSLLSMTNARIRFSINQQHTVVSNISVLDSWMSGIVGATWTHRRGSAIPTGGTKAKITVNGTWTIGVAIKGLPINTSFDDSLTGNVNCMK